MNNNTIPQAPVNKLYIAHSINKEVKSEIRKENKVAPLPAPQPYQYISKSYFYDSTGGGYQGL